MFEKIKLKMAARRVEKSKANKGRAKKTARKKRATKPSIWEYALFILVAPFRAIGTLCKKIWSWLRGVNLVALINLALLAAIIVLFGLLIIDMMQCRTKNAVVFVATESAPVKIEKSIARDTAIANAQRKIRESANAISLPLAKPECNNCKPAADVKVISHGTVIAKVHGDMIIDGFYPGEKLMCGEKVRGNLYLQNMRKYTLPCNTHIDGHLLLRNVEMLRFCGSFTITGNIYVNRGSSFGPIPKTARIGGQIIL